MPEVAAAAAAAEAEEEEEVLLEGMGVGIGVVEEGEAPEVMGADIESRDRDDIEEREGEENVWGQKKIIIK